MEVAGLVYWTLGGVVRSCRRDTAVRGGIGKAQDRCWPFSLHVFLPACIVKDGKRWWSSATTFLFLSILVLSFCLYGLICLTVKVHNFELLKW